MRCYGQWVETQHTPVDDHLMETLASAASLASIWPRRRHAQQIDRDS